MNFLYPVFPLKQLPTILMIAIVGALLAGAYGALHDQLSFTISPEYFTQMKFYQFSYANFGWPQRVFASEVGFLASWWVGLIAGWLLGRLGLAQLTGSMRRRHTAIAFAIVFGSGLACGIIGVALGVIAAHGDLSGWNKWQTTLELKDLPSFVIVAYLHAASYIGALIGIIAAAVYVRRVLAHTKAVEGSGSRLDA